MPYNEVFKKYGSGDLHSGSKSGPVVKNHAQAVAIYMSEKKKASGGNSEYAADHPMRQAMQRKRR